MRRGRTLFALAAGLVAAAWLYGFVWFAGEAVRTSPAPPVADGIVALTGGAERIEAALLLLRARRGRILLISGVGPGAALAPMLHEADIDPATVRGRITLGHALDTLGNAEETAAWVRDNDLHSVIVVTAGYHMKRALTELARTLPGLALYPDPVVPRALRGPADIATLRLLAGEYTKWLASAVGLTRLHG